MLAISTPLQTCPPASCAVRGARGRPLRGAAGWELAPGAIGGPRGAALRPEGKPKEGKWIQGSGKLGCSAEAVPPPPGIVRLTTCRTGGGTPLELTSDFPLLWWFFRVSLHLVVLRVFSFFTPPGSALSDHS